MATPDELSAIAKAATAAAQFTRKVAPHREAADAHKAAGDAHRAAGNAEAGRKHDSIRNAHETTVREGAESDRLAAEKAAKLAAKLLKASKPGAKQPGHVGYIIESYHPASGLRRSPPLPLAEAKRAHKDATAELKNVEGARVGAFEEVRSPHGERQYIPADHVGAAVRVKAAQPSAAVQTGVKGGRYILLKSGKKFYITGSGRG